MTTLYIILLIVIIILLIGYYFTSKVIFPRTTTYAHRWKKDTESGKVIPEVWESYPKEEIKIKSPFGYDLAAVYISTTDSHKTVIIAHGITLTYHSSIKYIPIFLKRGFNILLYDERHHGMSGGKNTTFGYYEKYDLRAVVDWALKRLGGAGIIGIHGESMGAAIALQYAAIDDRAAFIISDCSFSTLLAQLIYRLEKEYSLPPFPLLKLTDFLCTLITGMSFESVSPLRDVATVQTPILFIHGQKDGYIPMQMSQDLYNAKTTGIRQIYLAPEAGHAESFWNNRLEYDQVVGSFLQHLGMNQ